MHELAATPDDGEVCEIGRLVVPGAVVDGEPAQVEIADGFQTGDETFAGQVFPGPSQTLYQYACGQIAFHAGEVELFLSRLGHPLLVFPYDRDTLTKGEWNHL